MNAPRTTNLFGSSRAGHADTSRDGGAGDVTVDSPSRNAGRAQGLRAAGVGSIARHEGDERRQALNSTSKATSETDRSGAPARADGSAHRGGEDRVRSLVAGAVGSAAFRRYFGAGKACADRDGTLIVRAPSAFQAGLIERRFGATLRQAWNGPVSLEADRDNNHEKATRTGPEFGPQTPDPVPDTETRRVSKRPARSQTPPNTRSKRPWASLGDFVVSESNRLAFAAAQRVAESGPGCPFSPLYVFGMCGVGKSHLLEGIASDFRKSRPGAKVRVVNAEEFTNQFVASVQKGNTESFRSRYRSLDLLCLDDAHDLARRKSTQGELLHTLDSISASGARVVIASDTHPRTLDSTGDGLRSRYLSGLVVEIGTPEGELLAELATRLASARGLALDDGGRATVASLAENSSAAGRAWSARDIEGLIVRIDAISRLESSSGRIGGVEVLRAAGAGDTRRRSGPPSWDSIATGVCERVGVPIEAMGSSGRHAKVVLARGLTVLVARSATAMSYPEIARAMGRPNHSSVITSHKRIKERIAAGELVATSRGTESLEALAMDMERSARMPG